MKLLRKVNQIKQKWNQWYNTVDEYEAIASYYPNKNSFWNKWYPISVLISGAWAVVGILLLKIIFPETYTAFWVIIFGPLLTSILGLFVGDKTTLRTREIEKPEEKKESNTDMETEE